MRGKQDHSRQRHLRREQTEAESLLWRHLRNRLLNGHKFRRQHAVASYIADLVCDEAKLIVEVDGGQHADRVDHDAARTRVLQAHGYRVIRFWNDEVLNRTDDVLARILAALEERDGSSGLTHPSP